MPVYNSARRRFAIDWGKTLGCRDGPFYDVIDIVLVCDVMHSVPVRITRVNSGFSAIYKGDWGEPSVCA